jgi:NADPH-dependent curcumin reductase CurA
MRDIQQKSITVRGFMNVEFIDPQPASLKEAAGWISDGRLKWREDIVDGLVHAPAAFIGLLEGHILTSWSGVERAVECRPMPVD